MFIYEDRSDIASNVRQKERDVESFATIVTVQFAKNIDTSSADHVERDFFKVRQTELIK